MLSEKECISENSTMDSISPGTIDFFSIAGDMRLVLIVKPWFSSAIAVQYTEYGV